MASDVFISYAREDGEFVGRLREALVAAGQDVWVDTERMRPSEDWMGRIRAEMVAAHAVVFVISPDWVASRVCQDELGLAVSLNKRRIPLVHRDAATEQVPEDLRRLNWIFCRGEAEFAPGLARLVDALHTDLDWVNAHVALSIKAEEWAAKAASAALLLRGRELEAAERWHADAARHPATPPTVRQSEFLLASRQAATRRQRFWAVGGAATLAVIGVALGATYQANERALLQEQVAAAARAAERAASQVAEQKTKVAYEQTKVAGLEKSLKEKAEAEKHLAEQRAAQEARDKQEQAALKLIAEANRILFRQPDQALLIADQARQAAPGETSRALAESTLDAALRVLRLRRDAAKRDGVNWGSSGGDVAPMWFRGRLSARLSADGRFAIMTTERGAGGNQPPGDAYLLDNETLKLVKLAPPDPGGLIRRLEYTGFSASGARIFVSRQYDIEIYRSDGRFERRIGGGRLTKYPIQVVEGVRDDGLLVYGDTDGGLFTVEPASQRVTQLDRRPGAPVTELRVSPSGRWLAAIRHNGRLSLWPVGSVAEHARLPELPPEGVLTATFNPSRNEDELALAGRAGRIEIWSLAGGRPVRRAAMRHGDAAVGYLGYQGGGARLVSVADDQTTWIWNARSGTRLSQVAPGTPIDWRAQRATPRVTLARPGVVTAPLAQRTMPIEQVPRVQSVQRVGGRTWLMTVTDAGGNWPPPGPAYLVRGETAVAFPDTAASIRAVVGDGTQTWLIGKDEQGRTGAFLVEGGEVRLYPARHIEVQRVEFDAGRAWLVTQQGAYRVAGANSERFGDPDVTVHRILRVGGQLWLATDNGAYRVDTDAAVQVTDVALNVREVLQRGGSTWILTGPASRSSPPGPVFRVRADRAQPVPDESTGVEQVVEFEGAVWLLTTRGPYRVGRDGVARRVPGCERPIRTLERHGARLLMTTSGGLFPGPVCELQGGRARVLTEAGSTVAALLRTGTTTWLLPGPTFDQDAPPLYRLDADGVRPAGLPGRPGQRAVIAGGTPWLLDPPGPAAPGPAHRLGEDGATALPSPQAQVSEVIEVDGRAWLRAADGLYRVDGPSAEKLLDGVAAQGRLLALSGRTWVLSADGLYRVDPDRARRVGAAGLSVSSLEPVGPALVAWVRDAAGGCGATQLVDGDTLRPILRGAEPAGKVVEIDGRLWAFAACQQGGMLLPASPSAADGRPHATRTPP